LSDLAVQLAPRNKCGLRLANPVITASGTFGYGTEDEHPFDIQRLGAIICKGTTIEPCQGNAQPRIAETPSGMLTSIGLQNIGAEALIKEKAPVWKKWRVPVIVSIAGKTVDEYARLAGMLDGVPGVSGLELNISCPNVKAGGMEFGCGAASAGGVASAVRKATTLPLIVKLTPNVTDIKEIALAVESAGADAISLINTLKGMAIDIYRRRPLLGAVTGGLSGPAIKPVALAMVWQVAGAVGVPVIGGGGISNATDAVEFIMAGASAVEVGTAAMVNPRAPLDIIEGLEDFMREQGVESLSELIGAARGETK
jgi:dihydroorotate dehydrogenase (NAD+) catalytic subunit